MTTRQPPSAADVLSAFGHAFDLLIRFSQRPVAGVVRVNGKEPTGMTIQVAPGQTLNLAVSWSDEWHNVLSGVPTTFAIEDASGAVVADAATITPDTTDPQKATAVIHAPVGTSGLLFHAIPVTNPDAVDLHTDDFVVQDGPPFTGTLTATPVTTP